MPIARGFIAPDEKNGYQSSHRNSGVKNNFVAGGSPTPPGEHATYAGGTTGFYAPGGPGNRQPGNQPKPPQSDVMPGSGGKLPSKHMYPGAPGHGPGQNVFPGGPTRGPGQKGFPGGPGGRPGPQRPGRGPRPGSADRERLKRQEMRQRIRNAPKEERAGLRKDFRAMTGRGSNPPRRGRPGGMPGPTAEGRPTVMPGSGGMDRRSPGGGGPTVMPGSGGMDRRSPGGGGRSRGQKAVNNRQRSNQQRPQNRTSGRQGKRMRMAGDRFNSQN